jgi:hypothetical protein
MDSQLPQPENAELREHAERVDYMNAAARRPFYEYRPLDRSASEIRLVAFLPYRDLSLSVKLDDYLPEDESEEKRMTVDRTLAQYNRPLLHCHIEHVSLNEKPRYSALSYVWGDTSHRMALIVDGCVLLITENLYSALTNIEFLNQKIWIDAICINQADHREKSWQVQQMRDIYHTADHTAAWLGEGTEESDQLMAQMNFENGLVSRISFDAIEELPFSMLAFSNWSRRPYWNRVWVQQEQRASRNVILHCGRKSVPRDLLPRTFKLLRRETLGRVIRSTTSISDITYETALSQMTLFASLNMSDRYLRFVSPNTLMQLLVIGNGDFEATDRRDYVYALLGMASDSEELGIVVDYTKSWQQVFAESAIALIKKQEFGTITYCNVEDSSVADPELPSWAPNWSRTIHTPFRDLVHDESRFKYSLCSSNVQAAFSSNGPGSGIPNLLISGTRVDVILEVSSSHDPSTAARSAETYASWLAELTELSVKGGNVYGSEARKSEAIWRTPVADLLQDSEAEEFMLNRAGPDVEKGFHLVRAGHHNPNTESAGRERKDTEEAIIARAYVNTLLMVSNSRKYFISKQGYLGLGPGGTLPGDLVVILFGLDMPFVLRPAVDGQYRIIGEAYVHGIMDGEYMNQKPTAETFTIC